MKKRRNIPYTLLTVIALTLTVIAGCNVAATLTIPDLAAGEGAVALTVQGTKTATVAAAATGRVRPSVAVESVDISVLGDDGLEQGVITITEARVALKEIEFERPEDEDAEEAGVETEDEFEFEGPFVVDLLADTVTPELDFATLPAGEYEEIEFKIDKIEGDEVAEDGATPLVDETDPLFGNSIYIAGLYSGLTAEGTVTAVPFTLSYDIDESFELKAPGETAVTFLITEGEINPVIIAFRLNRWFDFSGAGADFSQIALTASGAIVLDNSQEGIRDLVKENIENSADYGVDADQDGELEADEDDDPDEEDAGDFVPVEED